MRCAEVEVLICDYLDGTLLTADREELERHLAICAACAELARDARAAVDFMDRAAAVEPPPELITRLVFDAPWQRAGVRPRSDFGGWLRRIFQPVLQPRFVMGMALTILSFSMLAPFVGPARQLTQADLNPGQFWSALDNRAHRLWERTVKSYESIRFIYQIRSRLNEWQEQQEAEERNAVPEGQASDSESESRRLPLQNP
jgi:anti-sigma factor RsiW